MRQKKGEGPIIKGGGASKPEGWSPEEWAEYKTTEEYRHEVTRDDNYPPEPDESDPGPDIEIGTRRRRKKL
jgi:hypothetical protein